MTPEQFATIFVADLDIPKALIPMIVGTIQSQIDAYSPLEDITFEDREDGRSSSIVLIQVFLWRISLLSFFTFLFLLFMNQS